MEHVCYSVLLAYDPSDQCWWASVPEFKYKITAHGTTRSEALAEIEVLLPEVIDIFKKEGWSLPGPNFVEEE